MKYIISRYNHDLSWLKDYSNEYVLYDRSAIKTPGAIQVPNIGSDLFDKFTFIIENYENLPEVAVYTKANLFKYITKEEFDRVKENKTFTPLLTQYHKTYLPVCWYENGMYCEVNNYWYLGAHPCQSWSTFNGLVDLLGIRYMNYLEFAPGSNYILPRENILKHPKSFYEKLRSYLDWAVYPGEAQIIERGLYTLWL